MLPSRPYSYLWKMAYISICVILPVFCNFVQVNVLLISWANSSITLWLYPTSQKPLFCPYICQSGIRTLEKSACILLVFLQNCTTIKNWQHCIPFVPHLYIRGNRNTLKRHKHTHIKMPDFFWKGIFKWTWPPFRAKSLSFYDKTPLTKVTYPP